jgi:hypothetical protein
MHRAIGISKKEEKERRQPEQHQPENRAEEKAEDDGGNQAADDEGPARGVDANPHTNSETGLVFHTYGENTHPVPGEVLSARLRRFSYDARA